MISFKEIIRLMEKTFRRYFLPLFYLFGFSFAFRRYFHLSVSLRVLKTGQKYDVLLTEN